MVKPWFARPPHPGQHEVRAVFYRSHIHHQASLRRLIQLDTGVTVISLPPSVIQDTRDYAGDMFGSRFSKAIELPVLKTVEDCEDALRKPFTILFKHSLSCPVSGIAKEELSSFRGAQPDTPVFMLYVQRRELAQYVARVTGVPHASPQVIVIRNGEVVGTLSHYRITFSSLAELVNG